MDQDNKRYILKKLMQDALGEEERTGTMLRILRILTGLTVCGYGIVYAKVFGTMYL